MSRTLAWPALAVIAFALGACSQHGGRHGGADLPALDVSAIEAASSLPASYKTDILAMLRIYLRDPTNIHDASISGSMQVSGRGRRQIVCLRFDAKDSDGQYSGLKERIAIFSAGRLEQMAEASLKQCDAAVYERFPEAEKLSR